MSKLRALEARRRVLLQRCEEQRLELAYRVAEFRPAEQLSAWTRRSSAESFANHPFTWVTAVAALLLFARPRRLLGSIGMITGLVALASRASTLLRVISQLRTAYLGLKISKRRAD